jgi:hypothetical protein
MILSASIALDDDDILDALFTNEVDDDDDDDVFIFRDFVLLLALLLLSILAITKTCLFLFIYFNKPTCL